jgi:hypothetical protein
MGTGYFFMTGGRSMQPARNRKSSLSPFSAPITGILRMLQAGVIVTDYATIAVEMLGDNASPKAMDLYASIDMPFATLVGQLFGAYSKARA